MVSEVDVVVVGGGPSGLVAGHRLRDEDLLLLEAEEEVGGNARTGWWGGTPWPMGAIVTYGSSPVMALYEELGIAPRSTDSSYGRRTCLGDQHTDLPLWKGGLEELLDGRLASEVRRAGRELTERAAAASPKELDRRPLSYLLGSFPPSVASFLDRLLGWFGGTTDSYSAHVGVQLARSQMGEGLGVLYPEGTSGGGPFTFPGGLGRATRALAGSIEEAGRGRVWTGCPVRRVELGPEGVTVRAVREGRPVALRARAAVVAVPKPVAREIVTPLPAVQGEAMGRFRYVPFLVAGIAASEEIAGDVTVARALDGPFATFRRVARDGDRALYRCELPLPLGDGEHRLDVPALEARAGEVLGQLERLFPGSSEKIEEIRVWRRGRNWYVPVPEMVTGFQPVARRPVGPVAFAHADCLGPISEFGWAMLAADRAVGHVRGHLAGRVFS